MDENELRGLPGVKFIYFDMDDDFFKKRDEEHIQKIVDRYVKKTKPTFIISDLLPENRIYACNKNDIYFIQSPLEYRPRCDIKTREEQNVFTQTFGAKIKNKKQSD